MDKSKSFSFPKYPNPIPFKLSDLEALLKKHQDLLKTIDSESFSIFAFFKSDIPKHMILPLISYHIFDKNDSFKILSKSEFIQILPHIVSGYMQENPYHNYLHACDVMQLSHFFLNFCGLKTKLKLDPTECAGFLLAALVHDFKHPGVSSGFLENILHSVAVIYNNQSILENFHISEFFQLVLKSAEFNIFKNLADPEFKKLRKLMITVILGTDMALHNQKLNHFRSCIQDDDLGKKFIGKCTPEEAKLMLLTEVLHAADIGTATRDMPVFEEWTDRVHKEFFAQGDIEKKLGLPISFNCDREKTDIYKGQLGYVEQFCLPLYQAITLILPEAEKLVKRMQQIDEKWKAKKK